ncbi:LIM/homeobox protein Lhx3-like [Lasioglossum baleicum]|uniref:LIM/homeobox protein Lhx3-like n=1 Tax=Lasioglossum baleicum TaxID=434251 RepID=UPI003FCD4DE4
MNNMNTNNPTNTTPLSHPASTPKCDGCQEAILDKYVLRILERCWHERCLTCRDCGARLTHKCFERNGHLFCKDDYFKRFGTKCAGCLQGLAPSEVVQRAQESVYHTTCFSCAVCSRQLETGGEYYLMEDRKLVCKLDNEAKAKGKTRTSSTYRKVYTHNQTLELEKEFLLKSYIGMSRRIELAAKIGLSVRQVKAWFENRRRKYRKLLKNREKQA